MITIGQAKAYIQAELSPLYDENEVRAIYRVLMEELLSCSRTKLLLLDSTDDLTAEQTAIFYRWTAQLKEKMPLQYILGHTTFEHESIMVTPGVLIPRPETEELVQWVVEDYQNMNQPLNILDVGTGCGCITMALATAIPNAHFYAIDIAEKALEVAQKNFDQSPAVSRIQLHKASILDLSSLTNLPQLDIVVSNPPYIMPEEALDMAPHVLTHEPHEALFVPQENPTIFYQAIGSLYSIGKLAQGAKIYVEINPLLADETAEAMRQQLPTQTKIEGRKDLSGKTRMLKLTLPR